MRTILALIGAATIALGAYGVATKAIRCEPMGNSRVYMCGVDTRLPPGGPVVPE